VRKLRQVVAAVAVFLPCLCGAAEPGSDLRVVPAGNGRAFQLRDRSFSDLSGLTWVGGNRYAAVSDKVAAVIPLILAVDGRGQVTGVEPEAPVPVVTKLKDFEGIAWDGVSGRFHVSAEGGPGIQAFAAADGRASAPWRLPSEFAMVRPNLALESLTLESSSGRCWTANEEALSVDGPVAGRAQGTAVRLQEFSQEGRPLRQFCWVTEPAGARFQGAGNGVADLCLLPGGLLLVLERGFASGGLHARIFLADFRGATPTDGLASLVGEAVRPVRKRLLLDLPCGFTNYEGLCAGPELADGSRLLVMVADSNGGDRHSFLGLRLSGLPERKR
jgi:hypothetical protein